MTTERRKEKIISVLSKRQPDLRVVLEDVIIAHNASAVSRTCEAVGVLNLHIISPEPEKVVFNEAISTRAEKWLNIQFHRNTAECLTYLKSLGCKVAVTTLSDQAVPYYQINYCQPIAIVFGNEAEGVSDEAIKLADFCIHIPMVGMVQSLNLSVSVGIILYEAYRQRYEKGFYSASRLSQEEFNRWLKLWLSNPKDRKTFLQEK